MRDVRHVVASSTGRRVLLGAFQHEVLVRDLVANTKSAVFKTKWDGGSLALSDEVDGIVAAADHVHGMARYDAATEAKRWRRRDLKEVQDVNLASFFS